MTEFFGLTKLLGLLIEPGNAIFLVLLTATLLLWLGRWQASRRLLTFVTSVLGLVILVPVASFMLTPLEQRFPSPPLPADVHGIILLGGAQQPRLSHAYGQAALNERAERMTTFLALARRYPAAKLVASGGSADPLRPNLKEAETTRMFLIEQQFDVRRVLFETRSRNTHENAVFSRQVAKPEPGETWLLITSAAHLPRAIGVFRKLEWTVLGVPCDYNAPPPTTPNLSLLGELRLIHHAAHEWLGLGVYYLAGKTDAFFPAPH